jgi:hypothetical protein
MPNRWPSGSTRRTSSAADAQVAFLELNPACRPSPNSAGTAASSRHLPDGRRLPQVSPCDLPVLVRVSTLASWARGRRWPPAVDRPLIGRPVFARTGLASRSADNPGPPARRFEPPSRACLGGVGRWPGGLAQICSDLARFVFFSEILIRNLFSRSVSMLLEIKLPKILGGSILCDSNFWVYVGSIPIRWQWSHAH